MGVRRVRVELKELPGNASQQDRDFAFKRMFSIFKKAVAEAGIMHAYKQHEYYESKSEKRRRKRREAEVQCLKAKLREHFPEKKKKEKGRKTHD